MASRWSDYRKKRHPESDVGYLSAFKRADDFYSASNEPPSIADWRDDMTEVSSNFGPWISAATGWQIRTTTSAELAAAEQAIRAALATARADVDKVVATS